jgi:uncharacterized repeat protein (TIGR03803 family)
MRTHYFAALILVGVAPSTLGARAAFARSYSVLHVFTGQPDGDGPEASLIYVDGAFYGTTAGGGANNAGSVYKITPDGTESIVYSFKGGATDGAAPEAGLIDVDGDLYGTTAGGGLTGCRDDDACGTVFKVTQTGVETIVHFFASGSDGDQPQAGLIDVDGTLYGTTEYGGSANGYGSVFKVTDPGGAAVVTVIHAFGSVGSGIWPVAGLLDVDGKLYGTTYYGGQYEMGTVFRLTRSGDWKLLYSFKGGSDGEYPEASLINVDGTLYGTTVWGGGNGCVKVGEGCGTVFTVTKTGVEKVLHTFVYGGDGSFPEAPLINDGGTLYGTTFEGGTSKQDGCRTNGCGTVFRITPSGVETVLHSFQFGGRFPMSGLAKLGHKLYGTTLGHGASGGGTVFSISR